MRTLKALGPAGSHQGVLALLLAAVLCLELRQRQAVLELDGVHGHIALLGLPVHWGPVVVGLLALAIGYALPQSFTTQAILALPTPTQAPTPTPVQAATMMVSPVVLDTVIGSLKLFAGRTIEAARTALASQIRATVGKDGLLRLDVTANSPLEAQTLANAVIDTWLKSTVPGEQGRADLEKRLAYAKVALGALQARYFAEVLTIPRMLQGLSGDIVKQLPTLPIEPTAPKKSLMAVLAALGSGLALLPWVSKSGRVEAAGTEAWLPCIPHWCALYRPYF